MATRASGDNQYSSLDRDSRDCSMTLCSPMVDASMDDTAMSDDELSSPSAFAVLLSSVGHAGWCLKYCHVSFRSPVYCVGVGFGVGVVAGAPFGRACSEQEGHKGARVGGDAQDGGSHRWRQPPGRPGL